MTTAALAPDDLRPERRSKYHEADVVVVGAGVFGCAIAYALANQDRSVILLERWLQEPNRIVGELLQPGGVNALKKLGLDHCVEGIDAIPCYGYNVIRHGTEVVIAYPEQKPIAGAEHLNGHANGRANGHANGHANGSANKSQSEKAGSSRPEGRSFHHGRFITQLRKACIAHPNITVFESEVVATIKGEHSKEILGVEARTKNPATGKKEQDYYFAQLTVIADGYASTFRKQYIRRDPIVRSKFYALELIDCPLPNPGYGHVVIGSAKSPTLLYQIGTRETRALIDVPEKLPEASPAAGGVRGYINNVVLPTLPEQVKPSVVAALADGKIPKSMPNSWLPPTKQDQYPGMVILGDAMNMRHPLTGGGMTVAFNDVVILSELLHPSRIPELGDTDAVQKAMRTFHWRRKSLTSIINVLAQALYSLFAAEDKRLTALQNGCFAYFEKGITDEPVGMLGGLIHQPLLLAYHFFSVAFLAIWLEACAVMGGNPQKNGEGANWILGFWKLPLVFINAVLILWKASVVFLPVFWKELQ